MSILQIVVFVFIALIFIMFAARIVTEVVKFLYVNAPVIIALAAAVSFMFWYNNPGKVEEFKKDYAKYTKTIENTSRY